MKKLCILLSVATLLTACYYDESLDSTVFIPDKDDPNLPAYTEWGYNSFGALYERQYFYSTGYIVPCKILYRQDSLSVMFQGALAYEEASLTFTFTPIDTVTGLAQPVNSLTDLACLNGYRIDLAKDASVVLKVERFQENMTSTVLKSDTLNVQEGYLHVKRYQEIYVDDRFSRIVLSGEFAFSILREDNFVEAFKYGRFDVGISSGDFSSVPAVSQGE